RFGAGVPRIQLVRAEVVVHMPNARAVGVGDAACQRRPQVAQTDCGQPSFDRQFDSPGGRGTQAFGDQSARLAVDGESEAEHAPGVRTPRTTVVGRPTVRGKFLFLGGEKFWVRGISYGTFYMDENRQERLVPDTVEKDFSEMAARGFNVVRVYTAPPPWLLD